MYLAILILTNCGCLVLPTYSPIVKHLSNKLFVGAIHHNVMFCSPCSKTLPAPVVRGGCAAVNTFVSDDRGAVIFLAIDIACFFLLGFLFRFTHNFLLVKKIRQIGAFAVF